MGKHALDQLADLAAYRHQVLHLGRIADGAGQVHQVDPLQGKQVTLGHHATQALVFDQAHVGDMPLGHGDSGVECAVVRREEERPMGHVPVDRLGEIAGAVGHHLAQVAQGENPQGRLVFIDDHNAAHLLLMHQRDRFAQRRLRAAGDRVTHGQFAQAGVQGILGAEGFHGFLLHLLVDLVQQAADAPQGEVAKRAGKGKQLDECRFVQLQAERVFGGFVLGTGRAFAQQRGEGEALAGGDFKSGLGRVRPFADNPALLDDVKVLHRPARRLEDALAGAIETQLALLDQKGQVGIFHLVEGREALQELQGAMNVLQYGGFSRLGEGISFTHNSDRDFFVVIVLHGRLLRGRCPLDVSLGR